MTTTPNLPAPAGATADDWCDQTDTDGADMARALTSSRHDTDIDVYVRGAKHHDGSVSRDIVVRELNADAPMTIKQARQLARALAELVAEAEQMDGRRQDRDLVVRPRKSRPVTSVWGGAPTQHEPGGSTLDGVTQSQRLALVLGLNIALVAALVIVGVTAQSLGVLAAGVDYLADAAAIAVSLFAIRLGRRPERSAAHANATDIAALVNAGWLLALNVWIAVAATRRLVSGVPDVHGLPVLIVSGAAALVMLAGALVIGRDLDDADGNEDLNIKAVLLDTAADAGAAAGVAVTGAIIFLTGRWFWLDPAVALLIAIVISYHAGGLIRRVFAALRIRTDRKRDTIT